MRHPKASIFKKKSDSTLNPVPEKSQPFVADTLTAAEAAGGWDQVLHGKSVGGRLVMTGRGHDVQPLPSEAPRRSNHVHCVGNQDDSLDPMCFQDFSTFHGILISRPRAVFHH